MCVFLKKMLKSRKALIPHFFKNTYNCSAPLGLRGGGFAPAPTLVFNPELFVTVMTS